jgi:glycosyltransferase involved in cell wall biosynthesis
MSAHKDPLVSVLTPVYNGELYLRECIESVLAQTYSNWDYTIVNNCSKDRTLEIAQEYATKDKRIRVHSNDTLLPIIANHNRAFRLIAADCKYVKVVSADDWLFPECITRMVGLAEAHPSVGIVGSYQLTGGGDQWEVRTDGLSYFKSVVPGREICRSHLLGTLDVFGNPTSSLYRADLVRSTDAFYPNETAEADLSAIYKHLQASDFGFVHQVLSYERVHYERMTTTSKKLNAYLSSKINDCITYGPLYLTEGELEIRVQALLTEYYRYLGGDAFKFRNKASWDYHKRRLSELGHPLDSVKLSNAILIKLIDMLFNPKHSVETLLRRISSR